MNFAALPPVSIDLRPRWREVVLPKEHGSWSLALEPLALGLVVAPSAAGGWLAGATVAGFLARRPLKIVWRERASARLALAAGALGLALFVMAGALAAAVNAGGRSWLGWLLPSVGLGVVFLGYDLRNAWRTERVEVAGAAACALLAGAVVAAAGEPRRLVLPLALAMLARAVPTVMFVRATVRGWKTGLWRGGPARVVAVVAFVLAFELWRLALAPGALVVAVGVLGARTFWLLRRRGPRLQARTLGFIELGLGIAYVATVSTAWRHLNA